MTAKILDDGVAHKLPADMRQALLASPKALAAWNSITPLARNEWICWTITVKTAATRQNHVKRTVSELTEGMRRPCCWIGCIHRPDKAISPSVQWVLNKRRTGASK
ncbi:MAG TPA: YdeI/OmpD-associated family protein [Candidatus Saccharimonadales bacterium]|nr:YdeI/OmpD-associated family protein [Candidatus Saccharimonadales bacterium]